MKVYKIKQKDYDKFAVYPQMKKLMDAFIAAGVLVIKDAAPVPSPTPDPAPTPTPTPIGNWRDWLTKPMLFVSAPDYWWGDNPVAEMNKYLNAVQAAGNVAGLDIELAGKTGAENYIKGINPTRNYAKEYAVQFDRFAAYFPGIKSRGLIANVKLWNANGNSSGQSAAWWKDLAKSFVQRFGTDNLIVLPVNERDAATPDATRKAIFQGFVEAGFPTAQLIGYDNANEYGIKCGYTETHPQTSDTSDLKGSSKNHINCTDSRPSISYCYDNWLVLDGVGGKPKLSNITSYVKRCKDRGTSCSLYSFRQVPDYEALAAASKAWGGASKPIEPPKDAPTTNDEAFFASLKWLRSDTTGPKAKVTKRLEFKSISSSDIKFKADDLSDWPKGQFQGVACIAVKRGLLGGWEGGKFDHVRADTTSRDFKNLRGYIAVYPKSGETVRFWLLSYDGKQASNVIEVRWP